MAKRVKRWRVSDIVRAICKERGIEPVASRRGWPWEFSDAEHAGHILWSCAASEGMFGNVCALSCYSLPKFLMGIHEQHVDDAILADALVATARRLNVPRRA